MKSPDDSNISQSLKAIEKLVHSEWKKVRSLRYFIVANVFFGVGLLLLWLLILLEIWLWMPPVPKLVLWAITLLSALILAFLVFRKVIPENFKMFYSDFSKKKDLPQVRYLLDLHLSAETSRFGLHQAALEQNLEKNDLRQITNALRSFKKEHPVTRTHVSSRFVFVVGVVLFGLFAVFQNDATKRIFSPTQEFYRPNPFVFSVSPGNVIFEQGSEFQVKVEFEGSVPEGVQLAFKTDAESDYRIQRMDEAENGVFISQASRLFSNTRYYISMDGFRTPPFEAEVQLLPRFSELRVEVVSPGYMRTENVIYEYPFNRIEAYRGATLRISGKANQPLGEANIYTLRSEKPLEMSNPSGERFISEFTVTENDSLWFSLTDRQGLLNRNTFSFNLEAMDDEAPEVRFIRPEASLSILEPKSVDIIYQATDDFGFSRATLNYSLKRSYRPNAPENGQIRLTTPRERISVEDYTWDLTPLKLLPLDELSYWIEVFDNNTFSGPSSGRTATQMILVSSLSDFLMAQEEREQDISDAFSDLQEAYEQNRRELEELRQQIIENQGDNWDQSQTAEQIREQREEITKQLEEIQQKFEELSSDINQGDQLSPETKAMYEELKQLVSEIDDPEILKALEMLQKGLEELNQNMVRDALQQLEFNEDRYQERLNRTMELFKTLQMNSELDRMSSILEELARQEESLIGDDLPTTEEQIGRQEQIQEDLSKLQERMDQLSGKSPDRAKDQIESLKNQMSNEAGQTDEMLQQDINEMQDGSGDGSDSGSQERREQIRDQLSQMQQRMQSARSNMNQQSIQVNRQALLSIMQNLLMISDAQEELIQNTSSITQGSAAFVDIARRQRGITRGFSFLADSLSKVAAEIPAFPNRLNVRRAEVERNLENTIAHMAERDRNRSLAEGRISLGGINEIASMLADLLEMLDSSGGGEGGGGMSADQLMQQLQNMSGDQQQLNQQLQDLINDLQGERLMSGDQMDRLDQMARRQNEIRRQLREIQQNGGLRPGDNILSELQRLGEEMEDAINDLRGGATDRVMIQRQQNILSRMLQAERALNEREQDEERRGDRPGDVIRISPSEITLESLREQIRRSMQDPNESRYTPEYQRLIQRYFELLEEQEKIEGSR